LSLAMRLAPPVLLEIKNGAVARPDPILRVPNAKAGDLQAMVGRRK
jgi:hypothetical protein